MDLRVQALTDNAAKRIADLAQQRATWNQGVELATAFAEAVQAGESRGDQQRAIVEQALRIGLLSDNDLAE